MGKLRCLPTTNPTKKDSWPTTSWLLSTPHPTSMTMSSKTASPRKFGFWGPHLGAFYHMNLHQANFFNFWGRSFKIKTSDNVIVTTFFFRLFTSSFLHIECNVINVVPKVLRRYSKRDCDWSKITVLSSRCLLPQHRVPSFLLGCLKVVRKLISATMWFQVIASTTSLHSFIGQMVWELVSDFY